MYIEREVVRGGIALWLHLKSRYWRSFARSLRGHNTYIYITNIDIRQCDVCSICVCWFFFYLGCPCAHLNHRGPTHHVHIHSINIETIIKSMHLYEWIMYCSWCTFWYLILKIGICFLSLSLSQSFALPSLSLSLPLSATLNQFWCWVFFFFCRIIRYNYTVIWLNSTLPCLFYIYEIFFCYYFLSKKKIEKKMGGTDDWLFILL